MGTRSSSFLPVASISSSSSSLCSLSSNMPDSPRRSSPRQVLEHTWVGSTQQELLH